MIWLILGLALGFLLVICGGDLFVDSSVTISKQFQIPRFVIGATIVSLATTAPELVVSVTASVLRDSGIAIGNVVGSAIANIGLILGCVAFVGVMKLRFKEFRLRFYWMLSVFAILVLVSLNGILTRTWSLCLFVLALSYLLTDLYQVLRGDHKAAVEREAPAENVQISSGKAWGLFILGALLVITGSQLLVRSGSQLALELGIPSAIIGLTIIAVGTSLPELVTALSAVKKGVCDLSVGNILGANILNLALITGVSGTIHPLSVDRITFQYSYPWLAIFIVMFMISFRHGELKRRTGIQFLFLYALYVIGFIFIR